MFVDVSDACFSSSHRVRCSATEKCASGSHVLSSSRSYRQLVREAAVGDRPWRHGAAASWRKPSCSTCRHTVSERKRRERSMHCLCARDALTGKPHRTLHEGGSSTLRTCSAAAVGSLGLHRWQCQRAQGGRCAARTAPNLFYSSKIVGKIKIPATLSYFE